MVTNCFSKIAIFLGSLMLASAANAWSVRIDYLQSATGQETVSSNTPVGSDELTGEYDYSGIYHGTFLLQARADLNSLGGYAEFSAVPIAPGGSVSGAGASVRVAAGDDITVTGRTGTGFFRLLADLHGTNSLSGSLAATSVFLSIDTGPDPDGFLQGDGTLDLLIPFTYGTSFNVSWLLGVGAGSAGGYGTGSPPIHATADYFNSADFTYSVLDDQLNPVTGVAAMSSNGLEYTLTAVPIPATGWLLAPTLGLLGRLRRNLNK